MLIKTAPYSAGDSYASLATADAFHALRYTAAWTAVGDDDQRSAALVLASDYIAANYRLIDDVSVLPIIAAAAMTLAPAYLAGGSIAETDNRAIIEQTVIGPVGLQKTTKWSPTAGVSDPYPLITAILSPAIVPTSGFTIIPLVR
ncbi:MAG: hypothetical protein ACRYGR_00180 [Janthinobacterium lividum]